MVGKAINNVTVEISVVLGRAQMPINQLLKMGRGAVIELDTQHLTLPGGERLKLAPGMAATVEIHQGRRTVMEYLLSPVQRVGAEAARER